MITFSGQRMREVRTAAAIKREQLAIDIGRSADAIRSYESGRVDPPASIVGALARALGVRPGDLFAEEQP